MESSLLSSTRLIFRNYKRQNNTRISRPSIFMVPSNAEYPLWCFFFCYVHVCLYDSDQSHTISRSSSRQSVHSSFLNRNEARSYRASKTCPKQHPSWFIKFVPMITCRLFCASSQTNCLPTRIRWPYRTHYHQCTFPCKGQCLDGEVYLLLGPLQ